MSIFMVLQLLGGLAMFLYGMNVMGDSLERLGGGKFEKVLEKLTNNPLKGVALGLGITAIIQSSSATTVMVVGFVNSGIMRLSQAIGVIMGANIGTTVTAWLLSLTNIQGDSLIMNLLKPSNFTPILALIGIVLIMVCKSDRKKNVGSILIGFAVLMFGMDSMSSAVEPLKDVPEFTNILLMFKNPVLGVIAGAILTAIIQSSSASVGILQALAATGQITFGAAIPIIMGQNIGTCITAILSCIGANKSAKRAAVVHLYFNIIGSVLFLSLFYIGNAILKFSFIGDSVNAFYIAIVHTIFNLLSTAVLLPFSKGLEKLAILTIKDKNDNRNEGVSMLDERFLQTPSYAVERAYTMTENMAYIARESVEKAVSTISSYSEKKDSLILESENQTDEYEDIIGTYLVKLSAKDLSVKDSQKVSLLLHAIGDLEKISDYAVNLLYVGREINKDKIKFSEKAMDELNIMTEAILKIFDLTIQAFAKEDMDAILSVEALEDVIDGLKSELKKRHIKRLREGRCSIETGILFTDYISGLEKISDHCLNIVLSINQLDDDSYEIHQYMHEQRKSDPDFRQKYVEYKKEYALPYSISGLKKSV